METIPVVLVRVVGEIRTHLVAIEKAADRNPLVLAYVRADTFGAFGRHQEAIDEYRRVLNQRPPRPHALQDGALARCNGQAH